MEGVLHAEMEGIDMSEWIEYTGSDEQIAEIDNCKNGLLAKNDLGYIWPDIYEHFNFAPIGSTHYLICQPHPYTDLIKIWADTGCPVWVKVTKRNDWVRYLDGAYYKPRAMVHEYLEPTTKPDWNIPGAEYRLTPFED